jgi:hypothetical protein
VKATVGLNGKSCQWLEILVQLQCLVLSLEVVAFTPSGEEAEFAFLVVSCEQNVGEPRKLTSVNKMLASLGN